MDGHSSICASSQLEGGIKYEDINPGQASPDTNGRPSLFLKYVKQKRLVVWLLSSNPRTARRKKRKKGI
jgi:hypothetical protein